MMSDRKLHSTEIMDELNSRFYIEKNENYVLILFMSCHKCHLNVILIGMRIKYNSNTSKGKETYLHTSNFCILEKCKMVHKR